MNACLNISFMLPGKVRESNDGVRISGEISGYYGHSIMSGCMSLFCQQSSHDVQPLCFCVENYCLLLQHSIIAGLVQNNGK